MINDVYPNRREEKNKFYYGNNFLMMLKGKIANFYVSFPNSKEWKDIIFKGNIENVNDNFTLIRDVNSNKLILVCNNFIDYIVFE